MDETLRRMGLDKTRARKGAVRPKITGEDVRRMLADVATSGGVPFIDAASQAAQGNYGQAAISGLLDAPPVKMAGMALAPLIGMVRKAAPMDEALRIAQKNAAKPVSEGGLGLPPDNTPMDRARAMGFDTPAFHGTNRDFPAFDNQKLGEKTGARSAKKAHFSASNPEVANTYVNTGRTVANTLESSPPLYAEMFKNKQALNEFLSAPTDAEKWMVLEKYGFNFGSGQVMPLMLNIGKSRVKDYQSLGYRDVTYNDEIKAATKSGKDSVVFKNTYDPGPHEGYRVLTDIYAVKDPSRIRSRFAAFDPARINENNLLASLAALGISIPVMRGLLQEEEMQ